MAVNASLFKVCFIPFEWCQNVLDLMHFLLLRDVLMRVLLPVNILKSIFRRAVRWCRLLWGFWRCIVRSLREPYIVELSLQVVLNFVTVPHTFPLTGSPNAVFFFD